MQISLHQHASTLRAVNYRLSSTPVKQLPRAAPQIAASLWNAKHLLSAEAEALKLNAELSTLVHRFRTTLSSLLQDRTIEGRWAAVVLTKAAIEAGGLEVLSKSGIWVKNLLTILKRPEPPTTRVLAIICLVRIFTLTWDHPQLVREITTPALPSFIATCMSNLEHSRCSSEELQTVLEAFATLIGRHPTIFRTHEAQIRKLLSRILSQHSSSGAADQVYLQNHISAAQRLLVLLHHCAPKQGGGEKWERTITSTVTTAHDTCDALFRSLLERRKGATIPRAAQNVDSLSLAPWDGVYAGSDRLMILLGILKAHLESPTAISVNFPVGSVFELVRRIFTVTVPSLNSSSSIKVNQEVTRDEREALYSILPNVHVATLGLVDCLLERFAGAIASSLHGVTELIGEIFVEEESNSSLRQASYCTLKRILEIIGPSLSKDHVADIVPAVRACCQDLLTNDTVAKDLRSSAADLLPVCLSRINQSDVPRQIRVQMERTAVLANHRESLLACVMNPASKDAQAALQPSLMPMLARLHPNAMAAEALLRPRMPVVVSAAGAATYQDAYKLSDVDHGTSEAKINGFSLHVPSSHYQVDNVTNEVAHGNEDLYTSTARIAADAIKPVLTTADTRPTDTQSHLAPKRAATELVEGEAATKRTKVTAAALSAGAATDQLPQQHAKEQVIEDSHSLRVPEVSESGAVYPQPPDVSIALAADDSVESDFEMPEINPDPDTDPEDEEEEAGDSA